MRGNRRSKGCVTGRSSSATNIWTKGSASARSVNEPQKRSADKDWVKDVRLWKEARIISVALESIWEVDNSTLLVETSLTITLVRNFRDDQEIIRDLKTFGKRTGSSLNDVERQGGACWPHQRVRLDLMKPLRIKVRIWFWIYQSLEISTTSYMMIAREACGSEIGKKWSHRLHAGVKDQWLPMWA